MEIQPLSKDIYNRAKAINVREISLHFSGGSDEGNLFVSINGGDPNKDLSLESDIESWAWNVYAYSGDGDGNDYGDDVSYDLVANTTTTSEWSMVRQDSQSSEQPMTIADSEE